MRRSGRIRHGWVNWLAAVAILLQSVVPIVHRPTDATPTGWGPALASFCQASGNTAPLSPDDGKAPLHKMQPCGVCQTLQLLGAGFVPAAAPVLLQPTAITGGYANAPAGLCGSFQTASAQARAPPLTI
jgi:hypothetical protein